MTPGKRAKRIATFRLEGKERGRVRKREREKNWKNGDIDRNKVNFKYVHAGI